MCDMIKITVMENQGNQRLDRFLKKYFAKAPLSLVYRMIRKDVKVNGRRRQPETVIAAGDEISVYISDAEADELRRQARRPAARKTFAVVYEDENILVAAKPFGLLTHGDGREKKDHLANQVLAYLADNGAYDPAADDVFAPAPANRLDRNTTGLVIFGKNSAALRELNAMIRERDALRKTYLTIAAGRILEAVDLEDSMVKDEEKNLVRIAEAQDAPEAKAMQTHVQPLAVGRAANLFFTFAEVEIRTGRTHQIRVQLAAAGHPLIGDRKYGDKKVNDYVGARYGLTTQLLHASRLTFAHCREDGPLAYLQGREFTCPLPERFRRIKEDVFG